MISRHFTAGIVIVLGCALLIISCAGAPREQTEALHQAIDSGDAASVERLIMEAGNIDGKDEKGRSALHHAVLAGDVVVTAALLNAGADTDLRDRDGKTALHYAVLNCELDLIAMLLAADADVTIQDDDDFTVLDLASTTECEDARVIILSSLPDFIPEG